MAKFTKSVLVTLCFQGAVAFRTDQQSLVASMGTDEEEYSQSSQWIWSSFQADLSGIKSPATAIPRFQDCEHIGIVMEGDANRPDMRSESLLWVDFLTDQGYCVAYFIDWVTHASTAWSEKDLTMNFGLGWKDALAEVQQSDDGQAVQILNSTKENYAEFTSGLEILCASSPCKAKRVVFAFEDHGEYRLLGLPTHEKMLREDLLGGLRSMYRLGPDVKMLTYVSACKSGSMFGGPQYTAKELLEYHYFDCALRDDSCKKGPIADQTAIIAGHSITGVRQRVLMRATEAVLEVQAMCDFAAGDVQGQAMLHASRAKMSAETLALMDKAAEELKAKDPSTLSKKEKMLVTALNSHPEAIDISEYSEKVNDALKELLRLTAVFGKWRHLVQAIRFKLRPAFEAGLPVLLKVFVEDDAKDADVAADNVIDTESDMVRHVTAVKKFFEDGVSDGDSAPQLFVALQEVLKRKEELAEDDGPSISTMGMTDGEKWPEVNFVADLQAIATIDPTFEIGMALPSKEPSLVDSAFMKAFNQNVLKAWFKVRTLVNKWKASPNGQPIWQQLVNGDHQSAEVANDAAYNVPWGYDCGALSSCMGPFGRAQTLSKLHDKELGCGGDLAERWEGHVLASSQGKDDGIEENNGLEGSTMPNMLENLLRAISYESDESLAEWDDDLQSARGKLTTGDLDYKDDPMLGAALTENEPLDLMTHLDGDKTRPESILAFSASIPQIISSSLLPFTVQTIADIQTRVSGEKDVDPAFRAHVRSVEDQAINADSMHMNMMFGLTGFMMKAMLKAKGNENATLSITAQFAQQRAKELEKRATTSKFFKESMARKAAYYKDIAEGRLPSGFLSFSYVSPATNRKITRHFDSMLSSENFGSPIAFGNMLDTDVTEFFHHVTTKDKLVKRMAKIGEDISDAFGLGIDWFAKMSKPQNKLTSEDKRCCCTSILDCQKLVGDELKKSRKPTQWGKAVCPDGMHHYKHFKLSQSPLSCMGTD